MKYSNISDNDLAFIQGMPKVELHLHMEGAIPLESLLELITKYEGSGYISKDELEQKFAYSDFTNFLNIWYWKNSFIREYDDYEFIAENVALDLDNQNIKYAEMYFSPSDFRQFKALPQEIAISIRKGLNKHSDKIKINLIADVVRDELDKMEQFHQILEVRDQGIIGIGLGGKEQEFPPNLFANVFTEAKKHGLKTTCHAGEAAGADYIWQAIKDLGSDRIGHGTRAIEDPELIEYLIEHQIPIEMNPISNIRTAVVDTLGNHPIIDFFRKGMLVSVNTDDPKMFHNSLEMEFASLMDTFQISRSDVVELAKNAIKSAWCSTTDKERLISELGNYIKSSN